MQGITVYSTAAVTCPHILNDVLTCHRSKVSPLAAPLAPPGFQWCHGSTVFFSVLACVSAHTACVGEIKEAGTERRTSTSLSTPEADSCVYHSSAAAHLGTISLMFANFLFRPLVCGAGPRGVTVCAQRCITGSLGCQRVMSVMSWITIQHKSWWTDCNMYNQIKTFGTFWLVTTSRTSFMQIYTWRWILGWKIQSVNVFASDWEENMFCFECEWKWCEPFIGSFKKNK